MGAMDATDTAIAAAKIRKEGKTFTAATAALRWPQVHVIVVCAGAHTNAIHNPNPRSSGQWQVNHCPENGRRQKATGNYNNVRGVPNEVMDRMREKWED
jgi:hypothetical protein